MATNVTGLDGSLRHLDCGTNTTWYLIPNRADGDSNLLAEGGVSENPPWNCTQSKSGHVLMQLEGQGGERKLRFI